MTPSQKSNLNVTPKIEVPNYKPGPTAQGWHSIEAFFRCPKEYQFQHVRRIRNPLAETPEPLAVGLCFHAGRAAWFAGGFRVGAEAWQEVEEAVNKEAARQPLPIAASAARRALVLLKEYTDHWSKRPTPKPLGVEYEIGPALIAQGVGLERTARLDDVSVYPEGGNGLWIGEAKTTSQSINDTANQYELHGQILLQAALWKVAPQGEAKHGPIKGIMLDIIKKPYGSERAQMARVPVSIPEHVLTWFIEHSLVPAIQGASAVEWDGQPWRNVSACTRMFGKGRSECPYRDLCRHGRAASGRYVLEDGSSLLSHKPVDGKTSMPWE